MYKGGSPSPPQSQRRPEHESRSVLNNKNIWGLMADPLYRWMDYFMENLTRNWIRILGYPHEILEISICL
jgi:hypothetical protein